MTTNKKVRAKVGDVFRIKLSPSVHVYGQVVAKDGPQHLVVLFVDAPADFAPEVLSSGIRLAGIVFDAKLRNGDWPIITTTTPVPIERPWFTSGDAVLGGVAVETFDGTVRRAATPDEVGRYGHRNISYPAVLQLAAEASMGLRTWQADFDHFRRLALDVSPHVTFSNAD
jgi:hypothetical protein